ncbi:MAG TPA: hypothetical protein VHT53_11100, partial [Candidatus Elarobacter sp.]|nr:hypothetical protein [Candidatus Elarobacter sp.]
MRRAVAALISLTLGASFVVVVREPARAAALCGTPGRDGTSTLSGVVNTYYAGGASVSAGAIRVH